ncbi:hypothetical protein BCR36DRAFT_580426 [Piromyces finnis]|uniref:Coth-domain-containing protein n=1 Tax=Piromyces finnis TaxID=1754191 RepID=A0A1Y1VKF9_9FUNG|nr:hypothetical protein BCR36DRAFT_580426 [Piromyces finnis]|eukprot:ORX57857.1 hypothetical protein BCR36DRAFT_580426 [Piromyces finnis]
MEYNTDNEFFKRPSTEKVTFLPEIWESVYEPCSSKIFNLDYVGTLDLTVNEENVSLLNLMNEQPHSDIKVPFRGIYIGNNFVKNLNNDGWELSIAGNYSRMFTKQSFKIVFKGDEDEDLDFGLRKIKLKAFPNDATMLREPISLELLKKVGIPSVRGGFARLYINSEYYGLYFLEDTLKKTYIRDLFHQKGKKPEIGPLFQAIPYKGVYNVSLNYIDDNASSYPNWNETWDCKINGTMNGSKDESFTQLINLMKLINQTDIYTLNDNEEIIHSIYNIFELDIFIRLLAMDYLLGRYHSYWRNPSNFLIYYHPALKRYIIFPVDFTSSLGYKYKENGYTYKTNCTEWRPPENPEDPLIKMIMSIPYLKQLFISTLNLIIEILFNPECIFPFIDSLKSVIEFDLKLEREKRPYHSKTSIIEEIEVKETIEEVTDKDANGFPSNSTIDTTIIIKKNTTITLIEPRWSIDESIKNIDDSVYSIGYGIKEWIEKRRQTVLEQFPNVTLVSAGSLVTRPSDPANLYSDSIFDYFSAIFPSGDYKLLASIIATLILLITLIFIIHVKCKKPTEMEGDEHDIRKYNDSFFHKIRTGFNFNNNDGIIKNISTFIQSNYRKVQTKVRNTFFHKSHNVD